eukprot:GEMP01003623.1.p1 GENE.GEMP01003623.1~~GEMP01003623.1.p1  ORF type:complete len:842 (+),score=165.71 GEMP01003623.1:344-2869(+)
MTLEEAHDQWKHRLSQFRKSLSAMDLASEVNGNAWGKAKKPLHSEWSERMETFRKSLTTHNLTRFEENAEVLKEKQTSEQEGYRGLTNPDYALQQQDDDSEQELDEIVSPHQGPAYMRAGVTEDGDKEPKDVQKDPVNKARQRSGSPQRTPVLGNLSPLRRSPSPKLRPLAVSPKLETPPRSPRTPVSLVATKPQSAVAQVSPTTKPTAPHVGSPRTPSPKRNDSTGAAATNGEPMEAARVVALGGYAAANQVPRKKLLREEAEHIKSLSEWLIGCIDAGDTASDVCYQVLNTKDCLPQSASKEMEEEIIACLYAECAPLCSRNPSYHVVLDCLEQLTWTLFEGDTRSNMLLELRRLMGLPSMEERHKHEQALRKCETLEANSSVMRQGFEQLREENQKLRQQLVDQGVKPVESSSPTQVYKDTEPADNQTKATEQTHEYMRSVCTMMKQVLLKLDSELGETTKKEQDVIETMKQNIASLEKVTRVLEGATKRTPPQNKLTSLLEMASDFRLASSLTSLTNFRPRGISPVSPVGHSSVSPVKWGTPLTGTGMPAKTLLLSRSSSMPLLVSPLVGMPRANPNVMATTTMTSLPPSLLSSSRTSTTAAAPTPTMNSVRTSVVGTPCRRPMEFGGRASLASSSGGGQSPAHSAVASKTFGIRLRSTTPIRAQQIKVDTSHKPKIKLMPRCRTPDQCASLQRYQGDQLSSNKTSMTKYGDSPLVMVKTTNGSRSCARAIPLGLMSGPEMNQLRLKNGNAPVRVSPSKAYQPYGRVEGPRSEHLPHTRLTEATNSSHGSQHKFEHTKFGRTSRPSTERTSTISANKSVLSGRRRAKQPGSDTTISL